ncbi:MAG: hypothetical protein M1609_13380 [Firmicutes bacterium]|nr:hypothetical protein [Bacillota bacterium]
MNWGTSESVKGGGNIIIRNLLRRISSLAYFHHGKTLKADFRALIANAEDVRPMANDLAGFMPWLYPGEYVHIGKGATSGLASKCLRKLAGGFYDVFVVEKMQGLPR